MKIETALFGAVEYQQNDVIEFPDGLPGFPDSHKYVLFPLPEYEPFWGMQSVEDASISFVVVDPRSFLASYEIVLSDTDVRELGMAEEAEYDLLAIVVLNSNPELITANLAGPLVINRAGRIGKQIISPDIRHDLKHPLYSNLSPKAG